MANSICYGFVCFVSLDSSAPKFFGFSEFLGGIALMVLAWTIGDVRYRFRVRTAPVPLQGITFLVVSAVGTLTLLTDLWRAEEWLVPRGNLLTPATWQALLAGSFLFTFLTWVWFAFMRPPVYGKRNAERYARTLYRAILKGSSSELAVISDELAHSAKSLIHHAIERRESYDRESGRGTGPFQKPSKVTAFADDILLLIADKRFCRAIVESAPGTALAIFRALGETKKYRIGIGVFAKNFVSAAVMNKDSFLYHEADGYTSGLIGEIKPLSQAMFANYEMVETVGTLLEPDFWSMRAWEARQWGVYCRIVLMTFRDYVEEGYGSHPYVFYRATGYIENAVSDLYKIDGSPSIAWDDDVQGRLRVVMGFIKDAFAILEGKGVPANLRRRVRQNRSEVTVYDLLADMIFNVIHSASAVRSPVDSCWWIQHNTVWSELFSPMSVEGPASDAVKFKVRRLLYDEVVRMNRFPNFKGARILAYCLNVMGLTVRKEEYYDDSRALQKAILSWTKKNFAWLHSYNPRITEACLVEGFTYEAERRRIVKTYPAEGLRREPQQIYFEVEEVGERASPGAEE